MLGLSAINNQDDIALPYLYGDKMMNRYITIIAVICLSCVHVLAETVTFKDGININWKKKDKIVSPDQIWEMEIVPAAGNNKYYNFAHADLGKQGQEESHWLFRFEGDGKIFWNGNALFVEESAPSNIHSIMLFNPLSEYRDQSQALIIDEIVSAEVRRKIKSDEIIHYYPHFVSWTGNKLVVSVDVMTVKYGTEGPNITYCLGYEIDAQSLDIKASLTDNELLEKYNTDCQDK